MYFTPLHGAWAAFGRHLQPSYSSTLNVFGHLLALFEQRKAALQVPFSSQADAAAQGAAGGGGLLASAGENDENLR